LIGASSARTTEPLTFWSSLCDFLLVVNLSRILTLVGSHLFFGWPPALNFSISPCLPVISFSRSQRQVSLTCRDYRRLATGADSLQRRTSSVRNCLSGTLLRSISGYADASLTPSVGLDKVEPPTSSTNPGPVEKPIPIGQRDYPLLLTK